MMISTEAGLCERLGGNQWCVTGPDGVKAEFVCEYVGAEDSLGDLTEAARRALSGEDHS